MPLPTETSDDESLSDENETAKKIVEDDVVYYMVASFNHWWPIKMRTSEEMIEQAEKLANKTSLSRRDLMKQETQAKRLK